MGVMRLIHLQRATPQRLTEAVHHCHCHRGKQKRVGFDFRLPSTFSSGWNWTGPYMAEWEKLSPARRREVGMVFDTVTHQALSAEACTALGKSLLRGAVSNIDDLSSNARRPSGGTTLSYQPTSSPTSSPAHPLTNPPTHQFTAVPSSRGCGSGL